MLKVGFVGAGMHATGAIAPSLRYGSVELVAIADLDRDLAQRNARWFGAQRIFSDHRELLENADIDAVIVVGPPSMQYAIGMDVVSARKHLFVEKPPTNTLSEALELRDAAFSANVQVMVGFMKRFSPVYVRAQQISQSKNFGKLRLVRMDYAHWAIPDLHDHMTYSIHPIDLTRYYLGEVHGASVMRQEYSDGRVLMLELEHVDGGISQLNLSSCAPAVKEAVDLYGGCELVQVRNITELRHYHSAESNFDYDVDESMASIWHPEFTIPWRKTESLVIQGYAGEIQHFADSILGGEAVQANLNDAIEAMRIMDKIERAPEGRSILDLEDFT